MHGASRRQPIRAAGLLTGDLKKSLASAGLSGSQWERWFSSTGAVMYVSCSCASSRRVAMARWRDGSRIETIPGENGGRQARCRIARTVKN